MSNMQTWSGMQTLTITVTLLGVLFWSLFGLGIIGYFDDRVPFDTLKWYKRWSIYLLSGPLILIIGITSEIVITWYNTFTKWIVKT